MPPFGEGVSFWALAEMIKAQAGVLGTDAPDVAEDKLRSMVAALVGRAGAADLSTAIHILVELGRPREAQALAGELPPFLGAGMPVPYFGDFALAALELGKEDLVRRAVAATPGDDPWRGAVEAMLGGEPGRAADLLRDADRPHGEAQARLRAARALVAEGRGAEAEAQLGRALAFWRSVGATRSIGEAEALLAAVESSTRGGPRSFSPGAGPGRSLAGPGGGR